MCLIFSYPVFTCLHRVSSTRLEMELTFHQSKFANPEPLCLTLLLLPISRRSEIPLLTIPSLCHSRGGLGLLPSTANSPLPQLRPCWTPTEAFVWAKGSSGTLASCISWPVHSKSSDRRGRSWWVWYPGKLSTNSQNEILWLGLDTDERAKLLSQQLFSEKTIKSNQGLIIWATMGCLHSP